MDKQIVTANGTGKQFNGHSTLANKVHIELPIVCMISTAEPTAFFTSWISACKYKVAKKNLSFNIQNRREHVQTILYNGNAIYNLCSISNREAQNAGSKSIHNSR